MLTLTHRSCLVLTLLCFTSSAWAQDDSRNIATSQTTQFAQLDVNAPEGNAGLFGDSAYVMPHDGLRELMSDTALRLSAIERLMDASSAGHRLLFVDACQERVSAKKSVNGIATRMDPVFEAVLQRPTGQGKLASCKRGEFSYENRELAGIGHGVFTFALLEALRGAATPDGQGIVRLESVARYVEQRVTAWIREQNRFLVNESDRKAQTPSYYGPEKTRTLPLARVGRRNRRVVPIASLDLRWLPSTLELALHVRVPALLANKDISNLASNEIKFDEKWAESVGVRLRDIDSLTYVAFNTMAKFPAYEDSLFVLRASQPFRPLRAMLRDSGLATEPMEKTTQKGRRFVRFRDPPEFPYLVSSFERMTTIAQPEPHVLLLGTEEAVVRALDQGRQPELPPLFDSVSADYDILVLAIAPEGNDMLMLPTDTNTQVFSRATDLVAYGLSVSPKSKVSLESLFRFDEIGSATSYAEYLGLILKQIPPAMATLEKELPALGHLARQIVTNQKLEVLGNTIVITSHSTGQVDSAFLELRKLIRSQAVSTKLPEISPESDDEPPAPPKE